MPLVKCETCKVTAEGKTYEIAADSISHGAGSAKCPGGPAAKLLYIDSKGHASATIPKKAAKSGQDSTGEFTIDVINPHLTTVQELSYNPTKKKSRKKK